PTGNAQRVEAPAPDVGAVVMVGGPGHHEVAARRHREGHRVAVAEPAVAAGGGGVDLELGAQGRPARVEAAGEHVPAVADVGGAGPGHHEAPEAVHADAVVADALLAGGRVGGDLELPGAAGRTRGADTAR